MGNRKRNVGINIRVTEQEKRKILRNAGKCKLSVSEYLRQLATGVELKEAPDEKLFNVCRRLQQVISNLTSGQMKVELNEILSDLYAVCYRESEVTGDGDNEDMAGA